MTILILPELAHTIIEERRNDVRARALADRLRGTRRLAEVSSMRLRPAVSRAVVGDWP